jgi:hypothetical protein
MATAGLARKRQGNEGTTMTTAFTLALTLHYAPAPALRRCDRGTTRVHEHRPEGEEAEILRQRVGTGVAYVVDGKDVMVNDAFH